MKNQFNVFVMAVAAVFVFTACEKPTNNSSLDIEGTYNGSINPVNGNNMSHDGGIATAIVTMIDSNLFQLHCHDSLMDTVFMVHCYSNFDSVMVCLTDSAFMHMYGHMLGAGHMGGGMMGDMHYGQTQWEHHLEDEHMDGDEHFGGFDVASHSLGYTFQLSSGDLHFSGTRQ